MDLSVVDTMHDAAWQTSFAPTFSRKLSFIFVTVRFQIMLVFDQSLIFVAKPQNFT